MDCSKQRVERLCANSGCEKAGLHLCSGCGEEIYCSKECQKLHWASHKIACRLAVKPEAAVFMQSFDNLSVKQLKNLLKAKSASFDAKKKTAVIEQLDHIVEKPQLLYLVKQHVQPSEIEVLLSTSVLPIPSSTQNFNSSSDKSSVPSSSGSGGSRYSKGAGGRGVRNSAASGGQGHRGGHHGNGQQGGLATQEINGQPTPDQMRQQASLIRKNPDAVRRANPVFAKMTNEQICAYADQLEQVDDGYLIY